MKNLTINLIDNVNKVLMTAKVPKKREPKKYIKTILVDGKEIIFIKCNMPKLAVLRKTCNLKKVKYGQRYYKRVD